MNRRHFLRLLGGVAAAPFLPPLPIRPPVIGAINVATYTFWRNQTIYGGARGGGKTDALMASTMRAVYNIVPSDYVEGLDKLL